MRMMKRDYYGVTVRTDVQDGIVAAAGLVFVHVPSVIVRNLNVNSPGEPAVIEVVKVSYPEAWVLGVPAVAVAVGGKPIVLGHT
jgi:hypothetical protein